MAKSNSADEQPRFYFQQSTHIYITRDFIHIIRLLQHSSHKQISLVGMQQKVGGDVVLMMKSGGDTTKTRLFFIKNILTSLPYENVWKRACVVTLSVWQCVTINPGSTYIHAHSVK